jgi:hypothetical protein
MKRAADWTTQGVDDLERLVGFSEVGMIEMEAVFRVDETVDGDVYEIVVCSVITEHIDERHSMKNMRILVPALCGHYIHGAGIDISLN